MSRFREVLKNRNFFLLWLGQIISQLGDRLGQMALIAFVYLRAPGSAIGIAKILSFTIIPVFLIGPIAGVYVDRWDRRKTMYICDFLRAVLVFTIPFFLFYAKSLVPIYVIIFVTFSIGRFFVPAKLSIVPDLIEKKDLLLANSLVNTTGMIAAIAGFAATFAATKSYLNNALPGVAISVALVPPLATHLPYLISGVMHNNLHFTMAE